MTLAPLALRLTLGRDALVTDEEAARLAGQTLDTLRAVLLRARLPVVRRDRGRPLYRYGRVLDALEQAPPAPALAPVPAPITLGPDRPLRAPRPRPRGADA